MQLREGTNDRQVYDEVHREYAGIPWERIGGPILDLGAHIGLFAEMALEHCPGAKVACVEASPVNYAWLRDHGPDVKKIFGAISGSDEPVELWQKSGWKQSVNSRHFPTWGGRRGETGPPERVTVPGVNFRKLLYELDPQLIKCDIEGGEYFLDWTDLPPAVQCISIELHLMGELRQMAYGLAEVIEGQGFTALQDAPIKGTQFNAPRVYWRD
jgi:FkbM family methyltransferase